MATEVKLGEWADKSEAEEAAVSAWLKKPGATVRQGELLAEITVEKVNLEVDAPADGILLAICAEVGEVMTPGAVLAQVGSREEWEALRSPALATVGASTGQNTLTPAQAEPALATAQARTGSEAAGELLASPAAKRLLRENNVTLAEVAAFLDKNGGRIGEEEVRRYLGAQTAPANSPATNVSNGHAAEQLIPYAGLRQLIGERMSRSLREMAQLTLSSEADVTELVAQREAAKATGRTLSYTALLARAVALTLPQHPYLNARFDGTTIRLSRSLNLGIAVDLEDGLVVPVIQQAEKLSALQLTGEIERLSKLARQKQLSVEDNAGGTFTISNLGRFEVDVFTPIVNPPQVAILGVGRIVERAGVVKGQVVPRKMLWLSLSFDHRVIDGAPAAAFLKTVREQLEQPEAIFK